MRSPYRHLPAIFILTFIAGTSNPARALDLTIQHMADGIPLVPGTEMINQTGERWTVTRLSYLLSGLALQRKDGSWHACETDPAWMSLVDRRTIWEVAGIPEGEWKAIRFSVGLPPTLNERDPAGWSPDHPLNPNLNGLHWSWQGGYIFIAFEGRFRSEKTPADSAPGFAYHLAREPFRATISVPLDFRTTGGSEDRIGLEFDLARVIDGDTTISFARDGSSTHSKDGDPLAAKLHANLKTAFRASGTSTGSSPMTKRESAPVKTGAPVPAGFPLPRFPQDLDANPARIALGRRLFHEPLLSKSNSLSCASCHGAGHGLSDPRPVSIGEEGRRGRRNAMPLFNLAWKSSYFWDGRAASLREQVLVPIQDHQELDEKLDKVVGELNAGADYRSEFTEAFGSPGVSVERLALALESFLLTLVSHDSKFDRAQRGEDRLTELEQRGFELFMTEREPRSGQFGGDCFHCHGGPLFTDHLFRNNGLGIDPADSGRGEVTGGTLDLGTFATPSLRNVALTAPYMHDGRFTTLEEVLDHYSEGVQRTATLDPNLAKHPDGGLGLTAEEKSALIAFLKTLTDDQFAKNAFSEKE